MRKKKDKGLKCYKSKIFLRVSKIIKKNIYKKIYIIFARVSTKKYIYLRVSKRN
jgi:hypothetical protein